MSDDRCTQPFWEGFHVTDLATGEASVHITLAADPDRARCFSGCERTDLAAHEYAQQYIRDLPTLGKAVTLQVTLHRVACPDCGHRGETFNWLDPHA